MISQRLVVIVILLLTMSGICYCQNRENDSLSVKHDSDTAKTKILIENIKNSRVSKQLAKTITRKQITNPTATIRSEEYFMPYEGKIIRQIHIQRIGFEKSVVDTTRSIKNTVTRIANKLHSNSREWLICDNLFIRENKMVNPYKMADNERYLRDLDFIQDAKIFIVELDHTDDSVDVIVRTRDVFSVGGSFTPASATKTRFSLYDVNLFGMGQRMQFNGLIENGRVPPFGYEFRYRKNSIGGSFITATGGYTQLNTGSSYGEEQEKAYYFRLDRPLVSPYTRFAGGVELSRNWSANFYNTPDTLFRNYNYQIHDFWVGYNITAKAGLRDRNRHFIAIRAFDQHFLDLPQQFNEQANPIYIDQKYLLAGFTFFKQNFYTARYIYGFGRTEDVPYGHTLSLYFGWSKQLGHVRPYTGVDIGKSVVSRKGQFYNILFRAGAFNNHGIEDASFLLSGSLTSRLISYKNLLMRQLVNVDFTQVYNQKTNIPLDINNEFGIRGFVSDSLKGTKRFHISSETICFTPIKILGFKLAPFGFGEMAWLANDYMPLFKHDPYFGMGGGIRTRNENLVFGTVELRFTYYPRTIHDMTTFAIRARSNLRVKYTASFVKPPSFVQYN
jgi:hypothetical protein